MDRETIHIVVGMSQCIYNSSVLLGRLAVHVAYACVVRAYFNNWYCVYTRYVLVGPRAKLRASRSTWRREMRQY